MITIAMASYADPVDVWHTLQSLRWYHPVDDCEILVVDNAGDENVRKICKDSRVRYERWTERHGTGPVRNKIFELASRPFVLVMDSHVHFKPGAIEALKAWLEINWADATNLLHGPMYSASHQNAWTHYDDKWRSQTWGTWCRATPSVSLGSDPFEIGMMGCGLFGCRKDSWLGFAAKSGFGGIEGVIHEKYRRNGRKVLCLPFLGWSHRFRFSEEKTPFPCILEDRIRNFVLGFEELGMDLKPLMDHFGAEKVNQIARSCNG